MIFSGDEWPGGNNLMYAPATWRDVFAVLDGDTLGLNLDPSHLVWQMIDYERVVREFGPRIYYVHAKDMEIDRDAVVVEHEDRGFEGTDDKIKAGFRIARDAVAPYIA
jgi:sugar phosphate isomerase/epimerase